MPKRKRDRDCTEQNGSKRLRSDTRRWTDSTEREPLKQEPPPPRKSARLQERHDWKTQPQDLKQSHQLPSPSPRGSPAQGGNRKRERSEFHELTDDKPSPKQQRLLDDDDDRPKDRSPSKEQQALNDSTQSAEESVELVKVISGLDSCLARSSMNNALCTTEILSEVLSYIPRHKLTKMCLVNKLWYEAACRLLYRSTTYEILQMVTPTRLEVIARAVKELSWNLLHQGDKRVAAHFPQLKVLSMTDGGWGDCLSQIAQIAQILKSAPSVESIELIDFAFRESSEGFIALLCSHLKRESNKIHTLRFANPDDLLSTESLKEILTCTAALGTLETFEIAAEQTFFEKLLPLLKQIQDLSLLGYSENIEYLGLLPDPNLKSLMIKFSGTRPISCRPLLQQTLASLRVFHLDCTSNDLNEELLIMLVQKIPMLMELYVSSRGCEFSIAALNAIGRACPNIEYLRLPGHYNLTLLSEALPHLHTMDLGLGSLDGSQDPDIVVTARAVRRLLPSLTYFEFYFMDLYTVVAQSLLLQPQTQTLTFSMQLGAYGPFIHDFTLQELSRLLAEQ